MGNLFDRGSVVTNDESAEVIRLRMSELRRDLTSDMREVRRSAEQITSPMFYIRRFPWARVAVAALVGYALVPKRKKIITPDPEMLAELVRKQQVKVDTSKASKESQSVLRSLLVMGLTWGVRTGLNYFGQQLAAAAMSPKPKHEASEAAAAPQPEAWNTPR